MTRPSTIPADELRELLAKMIARADNGVEDGWGQHLQCRSEREAIDWAAAALAQSAAPDAGRETGWRPIATAPKDGTLANPAPEIDLWPGPFGLVLPGRWEPDPHSKRPRPFWRFRGFDRTDCRSVVPTHWRPRPAPPLPASSSGQETRP